MNNSKKLQLLLIFLLIFHCSNGYGGNIASKPTKSQKMACIGGNIDAILPYPANLWKGIIAEDTQGNYEDYLIIASVVRNRLLKKKWHGLIALKRKDLDKFVKKEIEYAKTKKKDLKTLAIKAINKAFSGYDYAYGATEYEHTGYYPIPKYYKKMTIVKILYPNTKKEITLAKEKK